MFIQILNILLTLNTSASIENRIQLTPSIITRLGIHHDFKSLSNQSWGLLQALPEILGRNSREFILRCGWSAFEVQSWCGGGQGALESLGVLLTEPSGEHAAV